MTRFLTFLLSAVAASLGGGLVLADDDRIAIDAESVVDYVRSCRKANGAFGPLDQEYTDAAWNYPAVHALRLLGADVPDASRVLTHGLGYPAGHAGYGHWLVHHQSLTRRLLDDEARTPDSDRPTVSLVHQGFEVRYYGSPFGVGGDVIFDADGASTARRFREATELGYYNLSSLFYVLSAVRADGRRVANPDELVEFIAQRQAPNGGFVDVRTRDGRPVDGETHLAHTYHAVASLKLLNAAVPNSDRCVAYARRCQTTTGTPRRDSTLGTGGFLFDPDDARPGNYPDAYYTFAGLQTLNLLEAAPTSVPRCVEWVLTLQNHDGGFGDRPGWRSRLYSTYYAVHSLALLAHRVGSESKPSNDDQEAPRRSRDALSVLIGTRDFGSPKRVMPTRRRPVSREPRLTDASLRIHQGLFKTPVVAAGDLAGLKERGFDLLAMKTDDFSVADAFLTNGVDSRDSLEIVLCPEAYPHRLRRHGGAILHHVGNFTLDARWTESQRAIWRAADDAGRKSLAWSDYQRLVLRPLQRLGSLCYPEQDFELEYACSAYDDGLYGRGGYDAVQVGFNWSPRDFVRVFPWRERYTDKLPPVADADAHGDLAKWSPQLDHTRHLYVSRSPSYRDFLDAARDGRVVCVVVGVENDATRVAYYGAPAATKFVRERVDEWKWWR